MNGHQLYVLGFAFTPDGRVALIQKKRPAWQAGKLNGIGGKVENTEDSTAAMRREFREETGVDIPVQAWQFRGRMFGENWSVFVYTCTMEIVKNARTMEDERVFLIYLDDLETITEKCIENVDALIQLCRIPAEQPSNIAPRFELNYRWHIHG